MELVMGGPDGSDNTIFAEAGKCTMVASLMAALLGRALLGSRRVA